MKSAKVFKQKKPITFYTVLGKIGDIIMWPIIILALCSSFFMLVHKREKKLTSIGGVSFVNILSGSMMLDGFDKGETVITKYTNPYKLELGDIIAFYSLNTKADENELNLVEKYEKEKGYSADFSQNKIISGVSVKDYPKYKSDKYYLNLAKKTGRKIYFHRIIGIYISDDGELIFKTKGSSNYTPDIYLTRAELVVGKYVHTPNFLRSSITFCSSPLGMILLVCAPLCVLIFIQMVSLIDQITILSLERKLIGRKLTIYDKAVKDQLKGNQIEPYNKVYYYFIIEDSEKENVKNYLWKDILEGENLTENQIFELELVKKSEDLLKNNQFEEYWNQWIDNTSGKIQKQLKLLKQQTFEIKSEDSNLQKNNLEKDNNINGSHKNNFKALNTEFNQNEITEIKQTIDSIINKQPKSQKVVNTKPIIVENLDSNKKENMVVVNNNVALKENKIKVKKLNVKKVDRNIKKKNKYLKPNKNNNKKYIDSKLQVKSKNINRYKKNFK